MGKIQNKLNSIYVVDAEFCVARLTDLAIHRNRIMTAQMQREPRS
jgi:hypothetical protein